MCDTLVALPSATADRRVLFAKNSDRERNEAQALEITPRRLNPPGARLRATYIEIDEAPETHACLLSRPYWMWGAEMGANEHGVVIGNEALHALIPAPRRRALIGMDLVRLGLERGATARTATEVIISLLERHGQGGDCGHLGRFYYHNGFIIADAREAYVLETCGRWWITQRVESARALSNAYSIGADYSTVSADLLRHAQTNGWVARDGRFDPAARLIDAARDEVSFGRGRCARGQGLLDAGAPELTVAAMAAILRDHGGLPGWSPANTPRRTICMHAAEGARRSQSVASLVSEIGPDRAIHWVTASAAPCLSVLKPVVLGAAPPDLGPPPEGACDATSRWWRHERLHRQALCADFPAVLDAIAAERDALEARFRIRIDEALSRGGLETAIETCWREADAAEAGWLQALPPARPAAPGEHRHRASWTRLNQVAGFALSPKPPGGSTRRPPRS